MKKKLGILFSGQMRPNSLNPNYCNDNIILESISKYLLNDEFKNKYDYDIFFSVDVIDFDKTRGFFGENLKNIHITESNTYLHDIESDILPYTYFHENYLKINFKDCNNHIHALYQYYRMYSVYNLLKNYQEKNNIKYDYLVRIRPDIRIMQDIMPMFNILEQTNKQIITEHEQLFILKYELEDIFKLIECYGNYQEPMYLKNIYSYLTRGVNLEPYNIMCFCPEKQFTDHVYHIIKSKNMEFSDTFYGITYPSFNLLYRGNNKYGHIDDFHPIHYTPDFNWIPITNIVL